MNTRPLPALVGAFTVAAATLLGPASPSNASTPPSCNGDDYPLTVTAAADSRYVTVDVYLWGVVVDFDGYVAKAEIPPTDMRSVLVVGSEKTGTGVVLHDGVDVRNICTKGGGDDYVDARQGGHDGGVIIDTGDGDDTVIGSSGPDTINSGAGNDDLYGKLGDDKINAGRGSNDSVDGGGGVDHCSPVTDSILPTLYPNCEHAL